MTSEEFFELLNDDVTIVHGLTTYQYIVLVFDLHSKVQLIVHRYQYSDTCLVTEVNSTQELFTIKQFYLLVWAEFEAYVACDALKPSLFFEGDYYFSIVISQVSPFDFLSTRLTAASKYL